MTIINICAYVSSNFNHHHHHISVMQLVHVLTRSGLTYPEVSSKVYRDSFCQLDSSVSLPWLIYFEAFYLHVVCIFSCILLICPKLMLFLTPLHQWHFSNFNNRIIMHVMEHVKDCTVSFPVIHNFPYSLPEEL